MKFKYCETPIMTSPALPLLVLTCILPFSNQQMTVKNVLEAIKMEGKQDLECWVCNSMLGVCPGFQTKCNEVVPIPSPSGAPPPPPTPEMNSYFKHVYGVGFTMDEKKEVEKDWPDTLADLAVAPEPADMVGWTFGNYPGAYERLVANTPPTAVGVRVLPVNWKEFKGFHSCLKMSISTEEQRNGKLGSKDPGMAIPKGNPRQISMCSPFKKTDIKGLNVNGCKTIKLRSSEVEVCYCDDDVKKNDGKACNRSSYLRISQYWILAAFLLVFVANFGMNMQL